MPWYEAVALVLQAVSNALNEWQQQQKNDIIDEVTEAKTDDEKLSVAARISDRLREPN